MAKFNFFAAAIMVIAAAFVSSCSKAFEESNSLKIREVFIADGPAKGETVIDRKADNQTITLGDEETFSFDENIYVENEEGERYWRKNGDPISKNYPFGAFGQTVDTVYTNNTNFNASLISREGSENIWRDGNWAGTQVDSTYNWTISNGEYTFNFKTMASASDAVYSCEDYEVAFPMLDRRISAELSKTEKVTVLNGKTYKETDFVHASEYVFEVPAGFGSDTKSIELINKLVVLDLQSNLTNTVENEDYVLNIVAEGSRAYADVQKNTWDVVVYDYDTEVSRESQSLDLNLEANATRPDVITVSKADLGQLTLRTLTHGANKVNKTTDGDIVKTETTLDYVATFNGGNNVTISTLAESAVRGDESLKSAKVQNVRFIGAEIVNKTDANATIALNFDVDFETPNVATKAASSVVTKTITVNQEQVANDELIRRWGEGEAKANGNNIDVVAKFYEEWSLSGVKLVNTQNGTMSATLNGENGEDVVASNANFTTGNGQQGNGTYSSTASNGEKSFKNNYTYTCDNSKTFTYEGVEVKFEGKFVVSEVETTIGNSSIKLVNNTAYDAYPYNNKVEGVYTVDNASIKLNAETGRDILVEREVPHIIPDEWGKAVSYGVSAVPAHSIGNGNYADGNGNQVAHKAHCFAFENGAVVIVTPMETVIPTADQIIEGYFVPGNYKGYNSGVDVAKNGKWIPAVASDNGGYLKYRLADGRVRAISNETLTQWGWRNGNFTTVVEGYSFSVSESGVLTVTYGGQIVLQIR